MSYSNPLTWMDVIYFIIIKIIIVVFYRYVSEYLVWVVFYIFTVLFVLYFSYSMAVYNYDVENIKETSYTLENPWFLLYSLLLIPIFYFIIFLCEIPMDPVNKLFIMSFWEIITWMTFVFFLVLDTFHYLLKIEFLVSVYEFFGGKPSSSSTSSSPPSTIDPSANSIFPTDISINSILPTSKEEVFFIGNNEFTYKDAQAVCQANNSKLATYEQIEKAYLDGAEWLGYGWSSGQYAYFPLQTETWKKLSESDADGQTGISKTRPGISGGYFGNPDIKFGANCFGIKPSKKTNDIQANLSQPIIPKTANERELEQKVQFYKQNMDKINIVSFNEKKWSEY